MARKAYREGPVGDVERSSASLTEASAVLDGLRHALHHSHNLVGKAVETLRRRKADLSPDGLRLLDRSERAMRGIHRLFSNSSDLVLELQAVAKAMRD